MQLSVVLVLVLLVAACEGGVRRARVRVSSSSSSSSSSSFLLCGAFFVCSSSSVQTNSAGWGWENSRSCIVANTPAQTQHCPAGPTAGEKAEQQKGFFLVFYQKTKKKKKALPLLLLLRLIVADIPFAAPPLLKPTAPAGAGKTAVLALFSTPSLKTTSVQEAADQETLDLDLDLDLAPLFLVFVHLVSFVLRL